MANEKDTADGEKKRLSRSSARKKATEDGVEPSGSGSQLPLNSMIVQADEYALNGTPHRVRSPESGSGSPVPSPESEKGKRKRNSSATC